MKTVFVILMIFLGVGLSLLADVFLKKGGWSDWRYLAFGAVLYAIVALPVAWAFKYSDFGPVVIAWELGFLIFGILIASWYFHEPLTLTRGIALILALVAIILAYK